MLGKINKKARKQIYVAQQTTFEGPGDEIFTLKFALWVNEQILDDKGQILDPTVNSGLWMPPVFWWECANLTVIDYDRTSNSVPW